MITRAIIACIVFMISGGVIALYSIHKKILSTTVVGIVLLIAAWFCFYVALFTKMGG